MELITTIGYILLPFVAIGYVVGWAWLVKYTVYDWEELSVPSQFGAAILVTILAIPLSVLLIGVIGFFYGLSLFFCIRRT